MFWPRVPAHTGAVATARSLVLGLAWIAVTSNGVRLARAGQIAQHRLWMMRRYALTAAAISLRLYIGLSSAAHISLTQSYPYIAWLCWLPNLFTCGTCDLAALAACQHGHA